MTSWKRQNYRDVNRAVVVSGLLGLECCRGGPMDRLGRPPLVDTITLGTCGKAGMRSASMKKKATSGAIRGRSSSVTHVRLSRPVLRKIFCRYFVWFRKWFCTWGQLHSGIQFFLRWAVKFLHFILCVQLNSFGLCFLLFNHLRKFVLAAQEWPVGLNLLWEVFVPTGDTLHLSLKQFHSSRQPSVAPWTVLL